MMQRKKIFISHSAHKKADKQSMDNLIRLLEDNGFDVYCDREQLEIGDSWRKELYSAINCCQAAVILVTQEALDIANHSWVFKECSMLINLKYKDQKFPIIPIRMTDVTIEDIKNSPFKELQLDEIMAGSHEDLDSAITAIHNKLDNSAYSDEHDPLDHHYSFLAQCLPQEEKNNEELVGAIEDLDPQNSLDPKKIDPWHLTNKEIRFKLARILLSLHEDRLVEELANALREIVNIMEIEKSYRLICLLAPFWLDFPPIAPMEYVVQKEQKSLQKNEDGTYQVENNLRTIFGLNAFEDFSAIMYAKRAGYLRSRGYKIVKPPNDGKIYDEERYSDHIEAGVIGPLERRFRKINPPSHEEILLKGVDDPIFIILPYDTDKKLLQVLRRKFSTFIFIVPIGQDDIKNWNIPGFLKLEPALKDGMEYHVIELLDKALNYVNYIKTGSYISCESSNLRLLEESI